MNAPVALARSDWRRHDIVYSPELKLFGTVMNIEHDGFVRVEWSNGERIAYLPERLDEWQRINDERGKP